MSILGTDLPLVPSFDVGDCAKFRITSHLDYLPQPQDFPAQADFPVLHDMLVHVELPGQHDLCEHMD